MKALRRQVLSLAAPSILANITVPLVGMADIAVAGHLGSGSAAALIGGITIGTMLFDLLYWNFAFLRSGTGGLTAQAYGRMMASGGGKGEVKGLLLRALRIAILSGIVLIALQWAVVWVAFLFLDCSTQVRELATLYFRIRILAAPATLSLFAFKGWFIGLQDTVRPMIADLLVNGLNILLSFALGLGWFGLPRLGFSGVAWGTVIAQWTGFGYAAVAAIIRLKDSGPAMPAEGPSFFNVNRDLVIRSMCMISVYIGFTALSARYGDTLLAVSSIMMKLLLVFSYFTDGFAYAGEALTGKFKGAEDNAGVHATVKETFLWGVILAGGFMILYWAGGIPLFRLMTEDVSVVEAGREYLPWLLLMPLIGVPAFIWDGIFTGATATADLRNSTILCAAGFFAVWVAGNMLTDIGGIHILMAAYFTHLAIRSVYMTLRAGRVLY